MQLSWKLYILFMKADMSSLLEILFHIILFFLRLFLFVFRSRDGDECKTHVGNESQAEEQPVGHSAERGARQGEIGYYVRRNNNYRADDKLDNTRLAELFTFAVSPFARERAGDKYGSGICYF